MKSKEKNYFVGLKFVFIRKYLKFIEKHTNDVFFPARREWA